MLFKCWLLHRDIVLTRHAILSTFVYVYDLVYICLIYVNYFAIIIFIFVTINHIISLIHTNLFFGHVCQKFSLRVLFSFCLNFCQCQASVAYKSVAYKKKRVVTETFISWFHKTIIAVFLFVWLFATWRSYASGNTIFFKRFSFFFVHKKMICLDNAEIMKT